MNKISAIIVVKDNPPHLKETLDSISFVSEIIIVDIGIGANTMQIIKRYANAKIVAIDKEVTYVEQIREESKSFATHEYILVLDPDEIVSENLANELINNYSKYDYVAMPRKNIIFGKWIQHSRWWPDYQIRLFKKDSLHWPSRLHAQPETTGKELKIVAQEDNALIHYNYENITEYLMKMIRYAQSEAKERITQKNDYTLTDVVTESLQEFISRFFAEKGYKDGMHGLVLAFLQMVYKWLMYFYLWEGKKYPNESTQVITQAPHDFFKKGLFETNHWLMHEKHMTKAAEIRNKIINKLL